MKQVTVYEVDSDRGTYWESDPFIPEVWAIKTMPLGIGLSRVQADAIVASAVMKMAREGYEVTVKSHEAYLMWLLEHHEPGD